MRGLRGAVQNPNQNPRIASAERRVKPLARLLRCATALRVTAPHGCGSGVWYGRKLAFGFAPNMNDNILYHALALRSGQMKRFPRTRGDRPEIVAAYNEPPRVPPHARG